MTESAENKFGQNADGSIFDSTIPPDVIKGWNDRRQSNNKIISGMTPFVQLIGVFNDSEYERMFSANRDDDGDTLLRRTVVYTNDGSNALASIGNPDDEEADVLRFIREQLEERFINLYIAEARGTNEESYLAITPQDGILMAEAVSQINNFTGGIGITDLQVENRADGHKMLTLRMTVNDPNLLNEKPEYSKLSTLQGEFIVLYGWANPQTVPNYSTTPPPKLERDPSSDQRLMMRIPIGKIDSGGYWSAERMNITGYDFAFNELGQLEVSLKLMSQVSTFLATTRISSISNRWKQLMGTYDYDSGNVGAAEGGFSNIKVSHNGQEISLVEAALAEQASYQQQAEGDSSNNDLTFQADGISLADLGANNNSLADTLAVLNERTPYTGQASDANTIELLRRRAEREGLGYPYAPGISITQKKTTLVPVESTNDNVEDEEGEDSDDTSGPEDETISTTPIDDYKTRIVYYYLGWVMDGIKLSLSDMNRGATLSGQKKIIPKFSYMNTTPDSNIGSAFQTQLRRSNSTETNQRIQDAIIRLKEKCMPPFRYRSNNNVKTRSGAIFTPGVGYEDLGLLVNEGYFPCRGQALIDGDQSKAVKDIASVLFPAPAGAPIDLPHRGFIRTINFFAQEPTNQTGSDNDDNFAFVRKLQQFDNNNNTNLLEIARSGNGIRSFFVPDWYEYFDDEGNPTGGSENGFDPLNPTDYMAAERGGRFYYLVTYTYLSASGGLSGQNERTRIIEVDQFRQESFEIWNLTQRRWYNLYINYLGNYFENIIRNRIAELQEEGRTVEDIYDEPVDLDFLTSKQYRNDRFREGSNERFPRLPEFLDIKDVPPDDELLESIERAENRVPSLRESIEDSTQKQAELVEEIQEKINSIIRLQSVEGTTVLDRENAGIEQLTGGRYSRSAFNDDGTPRDNVVMGLQQLNFSGNSDVVLSRTNYGYGGSPTQTDPVGNLFYSGFSNFLRNIEGDYNYNVNEFATLIELDNTSLSQSPTVSVEYILFVLYGARTNNFKKNFGDEGNEQIKFRNGRTVEDIASDFDNFRQDANNDFNRDGVVDLDDFFLLADNFNLAEYEENRINGIVDDLQNIVNRKMAQIARIRESLEPLYLAFDQYQINIDSANEQIGNLEILLRRFSRISTEEGRLQPLSLYEDTSDIDDLLEVDMGRAEPMRLESKVAQQWYRAFSGIVQRGAGDVSNYGPAKGGTCYFPPSNVKTFRYDEDRAGRDIIGIPKTILDPIEFRKANQTLSLVESAVTTVTIFEDQPPPDASDEEIEALRDSNQNTVGVPAASESTEVFTNWQIYGNPIAPNDPNFSTANQYGFITGPKIETLDADNNVIGVSGGNYVKDYQDFLNIFNVEIDPTLGDDYTIIGEWPTNSGDTPYYMIDEANNIIIPDGKGFFEQSGWYLGSGALPVYLYPSRAMATQIDPTKTTSAMPYGTPNGEYGLTSQAGQEVIMGHAEGKDDGKGGGHYKERNRAGERNHLLNQLGRRFDQAIDTKSATTLTKGIQQGWTPSGEDLEPESNGGSTLEPGTKGSPLMNIGTPTEPKLVKQYSPLLRSSLPVNQNEGDFTSYGARIGRGEHCMNLTVDMKRSLVIRRRNWYQPPAGASDEQKVFYSLGDDDPTAHSGSPGSAGAKKIDWNQLTKETTLFNEKKVFNYWVVKGDQNAGTARMIPVYAMAGSVIPTLDAYEPDPDGNTVKVPSDDEDFDILSCYKPRKGAVVAGPRINKTSGYSNQYYPYGTGHYKAGVRQYGSAAFPEKSPNKNFLYIGDFLDRLPGRGFFTRINNNNNSPTQLLPDGEIVDGEEINLGFVTFVLRNVLAPLPKNRRIGSRGGGSTPKGRIKVINSKWGGDKDEWRLQDVTYGHLFRPEDDDDEDLSNTSPRFADLSNFTIDNVADMPIRRDVIENLMNKQNSNMSIFQFLKEIMRPSSIGVDGNNVNVGMRIRTDNVMEVFSASKNWKNVARRSESDIDEAIFMNRYPTDNILFDFKANDSLIERIDMSSKFDPGLTMTFELGARAFAGDPQKFAQFLSIGNIAVELKQFLKSEDPALENVITIADPDATGVEGQVSYAKEAFFGNPTGDAPTVPANLITKFLMNNPERMAKLNAMLGAQEGSNFATQLLSNYMRKTTITIHGTTNIIPFTTIHVRGVLPQLEGMYLVTHVRESLSPGIFQTVLEATLIENKKVNADGST